MRPQAPRYLLPLEEKRKKAGLHVSTLALGLSSIAYSHSCDKRGAMAHVPCTAVIVTRIGLMHASVELSLTIQTLPFCCKDYADAFCTPVSRWDRLLIFGAFNLAAAVCFVICFTLFPVLAIKPRKFAILYVHPVSSLWARLEVGVCNA